MLWSATLWLALGCGGGGGETPSADPDAGSEGPDIGGGSSALCMRDAEKIAARRSCGRDDDCPCGAHCELGVCTAACLDDDDCAEEESCDSFGRCRAPGDEGTLPAFVPPEGASVHVTPRRIELAGQNEARPVWIGASVGQLAEVRVQAGEGVEIGCGEGFVAECLLRDVRAETPTRIEVRLSAELGAEETRELRVVGPSSTQRVLLTAPGRGTERLEDEAKPVSGHYRGVATLVGLGVGRVLPEAGTLEVPLEARLYEQGAELTLELIDPLEVLTPDGRWVGRIDADGHVSLPRRTSFRSDGVAGLEVELRSEGAGTSEREDGRTLSALLDLKTWGFAEQRALEARWSLRLDRSADLPAGSAAPSLAAPVAMPDITDARDLPSGWESAFLARVEPPDWAQANPDGMHYAAFQAHGQPTPIMAGCLYEPEVDQAVSRYGMFEVLGDGTAMGPGRLGAESTEVYVGEAAPQSHAPLSQALFTPLASLVRGLGASGATGGNIEGLLVSAPKADGPSRHGVDFTLPCALDFPSQTMRAEVGAYPILDVVGGCRAFLGMPMDQGALQYTTPATNIDRCAEVSARYDCQVEELPTPEPIRYETDGVEGSRVLAFSVPAQFGSLRCDIVVPPGQVLSGQVTRVCRMRRQHARCAEATLCHNAGTDSNVEEPVLNAVEAAGGDPVCENGRGELGVGFYRFAAGRRAPEVLEACLADLERLAADPTTFSSEEAIEARACLEGPRFFAALGHALADARAAESAPSSFVVRPRAAAIGHRLLQSFLTVQTFLAREASQGERVGEAVRRLPESNGMPGVPLERVFERTLAAVSLLLHPRFGAPVLGLPPALLRAPDPRPLLGLVDVAAPHHDHALGLPVALEETVHALLELGRVRLERQRRGLDDGATRDFGKLVRMVLWLESVSAELALHARDGATPAWQRDYEVAAGAAEKALAFALAKSDDVSEAQNPFGIDDADLPLYFLGDESSAGRRFSAISDFLIGTGPGSFAWAPTAVRKAQEGLTGLRESWLKLTDRELMRTRDQASLARELDAIRFEFGDRVAAFCSAPSTLDTASILEGWEAATGRPFSAHDCFRVTEGAECKVDPKSFATQLRPADFELQLCLADKVSQRRKLPYGGSPEVAQLLAAWPTCRSLNVEACASGDCLACRTDSANVSVPFALLRNDLPRLVAYSQGESLRVERELCATLHPSANTGLATAPRPSPAPTCFRGALGEQMLTLEALVRDIDIAQAEFSERYEAYDLSMQRCILMQSSFDSVNDAQTAHNKTMSSLRKTRVAMEGIAAVAGAVKDCSAIAAGDMTGIASTVGCGAAAVEATASIGVALSNARMENAEQEHALAIQKLEQTGEIDLCKNDAAMELVGLRSGALRIQRAFDDLRVAQYQLQEMKISADTYYQDGLLALQRARGRLVSPPAHDFWIDETSRRFEDRMSFAQRITYLAVRAVEYEFQQSLAARGDVLEAALPDQLEGVLEELWSLAGTRTVEGRIPSDLRLVVSLRDELLQVADRSGVPESEHRLDDAERFRVLLRDPAHAVFAADGSYLGQRIPFSVAPLSKLGVGDPRGIPVLAGRDCAERLWSVNASVHGGDGVVDGSGSFVRIELQKANTFYSQWCGASGPDDFQMASVHPSKNLFRGGDDDSISSQLGLGRQPASFASSRLQAALNVSRKDLESDAYTERASGELAARGLYGDYAVFLPASSLSLPRGPGGERSQGLDLDRVDDILLRFDYVSVARN